MKHSWLYWGTLVLTLIMLLISRAIHDSHELLSYLCGLMGFLPTTVVSIIDTVKYSRLSGSEKKKLREKSFRAVRPIKSLVWNNPYVWMALCCAGCVSELVMIGMTLVKS